MIEIGALRERLGEGDWVVFDPGGRPLDLAVPPQAGPAILLVSGVTDAVKQVDDDGLIAGSVDRRRLWAVEAFLLNRVVLESLEDETLRTEWLLEAVPRTGFAWQVVIGSE